MSDLGAEYDAEQAKLSELMAIMSAESTVQTARSAELAEIQRAAYRRHSAAKGRVTRAQRTGDPTVIAAAEATERAAYQAADRISGECIEEMFTLSQAGLDSLGAARDQMARTWQAGDTALGLDREAEEG